MSDATKPAYLMVQITTKDFNRLTERYGQFARPTLAKFGGEMIAGSPEPKVLEGGWEGNWAAVLRFPSMAMAEAWYNSAEYQPLRELRMKELTDEGRLVLIAGI